MVGDEGRPEPAGGEAVESYGYIPYGFALDHIRKARPDLGDEAARALLLGLWRTERVKVVDAESLTHLEGVRQARWLDTNDVSLQRSWWHKTNLEDEIPTKPAAESKTGRKPKYPWDEFAICFGALLYDGRPETEAPEDQIAAIQRIAVALGHSEPERSTIQPYRDRWIAAYNKWKKKDDAGN